MKSNLQQAATILLPLALGACATAPDAPPPQVQARPMLQVPPKPVSDQEAVILTAPSGVLCAKRIDGGMIATIYGRELANGGHRVNTAVLDKNNQITFGYWKVDNGMAEGFFASKISLKDARAHYDDGNRAVDLEPAMDDAIRAGSYAFFKGCEFH